MFTVSVIRPLHLSDRNRETPCDSLMEAGALFNEECYILLRLGSGRVELSRDGKLIKKMVLTEV